MIGYITKDKDGEVYIHRDEPIYEDELDYWYSSPCMINITGQFSEFDNMSYTDEPIKVEINIKII